MSTITAAQRQACVDLALAERPGIIVEIGVYGGRLSRRLLEVPTLKRLFLVDSWEGVTADRQPPFHLKWEKNAMAALAERVKEWAEQTPKVTVLHMRSVEAVAEFDDGSVDFLYVDGDHTMEGVKSDIVGWLPKVRVGGILSGDDYNMTSVRTVVDLLLPDREIAPNGRLWWTRK